MKTNFRMTGKDVSNYNINMRWINESMHGEPIPPNLLNMYDLSRPLTSKEVSDICNSARMINKSNMVDRECSAGESTASFITLVVASPVISLFFGGICLYMAFDGDGLSYGVVGVLLVLFGLIRIIKRIKSR